MIIDDIIITEYWKSMILRDSYSKLKYYIYNTNRKLTKEFEFSRNISFDSETYKGKCKLLANSNSEYILNPTFEECLDFLFKSHSVKGIYRWFFNIDFDVSAILKIWNNIEKIKELKKGNSVKYKDYTLFWLSKILFTIKKGKYSVVFTDLFKLFLEALEKSIKTHVDSNLGKDIIDKEKLNTSLKYWSSKLNKIIKYCIKDCILTNKLADILINSLKSAEVSLPKYLCSFGSIAKSDFRHNCFIPNLGETPKSIVQIAYWCYYGGWFEVFKKGYFPNAYLYDINSQYPSFMRYLPNLNEGIWKVEYDLTDKPSLSYYLTDLCIPEACYISSIPIKLENGLIIHVVGNIKNQWLTWYDLIRMKKYIDKIHIGYTFYPKFEFNEVLTSEIDKYYPFYNRINFHYDKKNTYKNINKTMYNVHKGAVNSFYGCNIERHKKENKNSVGKLFNPIYASQTTSYGRYSVVKDLTEYELESLINTHTDSIMIDKKIDGLKEGNQLGEWNNEAKGKALIIASGQYQIDNLCKTRSFPLKYIENWFTFCEKYKYKSKIKFKFERMRKLSECLIREKNLDYVNTFQKTKKTISCNSDLKRCWISEPNNFDELMNNSYDSFHYFVNMDKRQNRVKIKDLMINPLLI